MQSSMYCFEYRSLLKFTEPVSTGMTNKSIKLIAFKGVEVELGFGTTELLHYHRDDYDTLQKMFFQKVSQGCLHKFRMDSSLKI